MLFKLINLCDVMCSLGRKLHCGHLFHTGCIDPWLTTQRNTCPLDGMCAHIEEAPPTPPARPRNAASSSNASSATTAGGGGGRGPASRSQRGFGGTTLPSTPRGRRNTGDGHGGGGAVSASEVAMSVGSLLTIGGAPITSSSDPGLHTHRLTHQARASNAAMSHAATPRHTHTGHTHTGHTHAHSHPTPHTAGHPTHTAPHGSTGSTALPTFATAPPLPGISQPTLQQRSTGGNRHRGRPPPPTVHAALQGRLVLGAASSVSLPSITGLGGDRDSGVGSRRGSRGTRSAGTPRGRRPREVRAATHTGATSRLAPLGGGSASAGGNSTAQNANAAHRSRRSELNTQRAAAAAERRVRIAAEQEQMYVIQSLHFVAVAQHNRDWRCRLHPSLPRGCWVQTRLESRIVMQTV